MQNEIWRDIPGYNGKYKVSNFGKVASYATGYKFILKQYKSNTGYMRVFLYKDKKSKPMSVHRLVLMSFKRIPSKKEVCNHIDGNRLNNKLTNLEWTTVSGNTKHAHKKGLIDQRGDKNPSSYISNEKARQVCFYLQSGFSYSDILLLVPECKNKNVIYNINYGKSYKIVSEKMTNKYPIKRK